MTQDQSTSYKYDVFISYSDADEEWVRAELLPRLEAAYVSYIEQGNFTLGRPKLIEIERAIKESRWTLLIITPSYLKDNWSQFDSILSSSYGLDTVQWRTIPATVITCELPLRLRILVPVDLRTGQEHEWLRLTDLLLLINPPVGWHTREAKVRNASSKPIRQDVVERNQVFISYAHADEKWVTLLQKHLKPLVRNDKIKVWDDTKIAPGSNWREEIEKAIKSTKVAILLVSVNYLASDFVTNEELPPLLAAAEQDGARILPVVIGHCRFTQTKSISRFQAVNDPTQPLSGLSGHKRDALFVKLTETVENALNIGASPTRGKVEDISETEDSKYNRDSAKTLRDVVNVDDNVTRDRITPSTLKSNQVIRLRDVLIDAFSDAKELINLARSLGDQFYMDIQRDSVTSNKELTEIILDVAYRSGRIKNLMLIALRERPDHPYLRHIAQEILASDA